MAEHQLDDADVDAVGQQSTRALVPEVVPAESIRCSCSRFQAAPFRVDRGSMPWASSQRLPGCLQFRLVLARAGVDAVARNDELRQLLRDEQRWLAEARQTVSEVRFWRQEEQTRFWPAMWRRWFVAVVFALVAAWAAGAGYAWVTRPYASELAHLRSRAAFVEAVERRILALIPAQRKEFEALVLSPSK